MTRDKNALPSIEAKADRRPGGFAVRFSWWDAKGKRRRGRGYGRSPAEARKDATDRWWAEVRAVRDILAGRVVPTESTLTFVELVAEALPSLPLSQRPKQVKTTTGYAARYWAGWCPGCHHLDRQAYEPTDAGLQARHTVCGECGVELLGEMRIADIRASTCNGVLSAARGFVEDGTVNRIRSAGAAIFRHAVAAGVLEASPTDKARRLVETRTVVQVMTGEQALAFAKALEEEWEPFVLLMLLAGLRLGEARTLRPEDVELGRSRILVRTGGAGGTPKSGHHRIVPIVSSRLRRVLTRVLGSPRVTVAGHVDPRRAMARAADAAGLDEPPTRHDLRHWFCSACLALGVPVVTVRGWLGHSSISVTDRYSHAIEPSACLAAILDELVGGRSLEPFYRG